jgi:SNF2 family DNA or RNA helicase
MIYELMEHQKEALLIAERHPKYAFFYDTGTGKTLIGIQLIKQKQVKTLIVCPLSIIESAWIGDIEEFEPELLATTKNLWRLWKTKKNKNGEERLEYWLNQCQIGIINFDLFRIIADRLAKYNFKMLLIDESSEINNIKAQITKKAIGYCDKYPQFVYLFSGTPAPNSELEYFSQIRALDKNLFGWNYYAFRNRFFSQVIKIYNPGELYRLISNGIAHKYDDIAKEIDKKILDIAYTKVKFDNVAYAIKNSIGNKIEGWPEYHLSPYMKDVFITRLRSISVSLKKADVLDLPERTNNIRSVILFPAELSAYKTMFKNLVIEFKGYRYIAKNHLSKIMKLREITAGFILGEESEYIIGESKLKALMELVTEIGDNQILIWGQFRKEIACIEQKFLDRGISIARIDGSVSQVEREKIIIEFKAGKIKNIIAHPKTLGIGHTFVNCTYMIYNSLSYSYGKHYQSMDRIYRKGQVNKCSYYYMIATDTIDQLLYDVLQRKGNVSEEILKYLKQDKKSEVNDLFY